MKPEDLQRANDLVIEIRAIENVLSSGDRYNYYISFYHGASISLIVIENDYLKEEMRGYLHGRLQVLKEELDKL